MTASRRHALAVVAAGVALLPVPGRAQAAPATIRLGSPPTEQMLPMAYAMRAGLFERAGIRIEFTKGTSGAAIAAAVAAGAFDIGLSSILTPLLGFAHNIPFTIIAPAGLWLPSTEGGLVVASSSPLRTPKDFVGKTISVGALNDITLLGLKAWMDRDGADSTTLKLVEIPQAAAPIALEQGRVDAIIVNNPAYTRAVAGGKARLAANIFSAISPRFLVVCYFTTSGWVDRNRSVAERFARVIADAVTYCNGHVEETMNDLVDLTGLDRDLVVRMKRTFQTTSVVAAEVQPVIDSAVKYKLLDRSYPASEIVSSAAVK